MTGKSSRGLSAKQSSIVVGICFLAIAAIIVTAILLITNSSEWQQSHGHNTPVGPYIKPPNTVVELPYNWNNVIRVCDHGEGIYEAFKGTAIAVVVNDPACK